MKLLLFIFPIYVLFAGCAEEKKREAPNKYFTDWTGYDFSMLQHGDIIVKKGRGPLSQKIADLLDEPLPLSHCGIVAKEGDSLVVLHSVAKEVSGIDGVQKVGFNRFMRDCLKGFFYVVRLKDPVAVPSRVVGSAERFIKNRVPFDYKLDHSDSSGMYCSEFVYWCVRSATGKDLFQQVSVNNAKLLGFNCLLDSLNFQIVCKY